MSDFWEEFPEVAPGFCQDERIVMLNVRRIGPRKEGSGNVTTVWMHCLEVLEKANDSCPSLSALVSQ